MKCSYCNNEAKFKCTSEHFLMCSTHLGQHLEENKGHLTEILDIILDKSRFSRLRSNILKVLKQFNEAKSKISQMTVSLMNLIEKLNKEAIKRLNEERKVYMEFLDYTQFCKSQMPNVREYESLKISLNSMELDDLNNQLEKNYSKDFFTYSKTYWETEFLENHSATIFCADITKEGYTFITGGEDSTIRVWDVAQKKQKFALHGHHNAVKCLKVSEDSKYIISGSDDQTVRIWSIEKPTQVAILKGHASAIKAVDYLDSRNWIFSGDSMKKVIIWDFNLHIIVKILTFPSSIYSLSLISKRYTKGFLTTRPSLNNAELLIVGINRDIALSEIESGNSINPLSGHKAPVTCLCLTKDQNKMVSGSNDFSIIVWDMISYQLESILDGHINWINYLTLNSDQNILVSSSNDKTVRIWNLNNGKELKKFTQNSSVTCILNTNQNPFLFFKDSKIGDLDINNQKIQASWYFWPFTKSSVSISLDYNLIGYGIEKFAIIWDVEVGKIKYFIEGNWGEILFVEISRNNNFAVICSKGTNNNLNYWEFESEIKYTEFKGHKESVNCSCLSNDELTLASGSNDKTVRTWSLKDFKQQFEFEGHTSGILSIKFVDMRKLLVSGGSDAKVICWNLIDRSKYAVFTGSGDLISRVIITDDEKLIISGVEDHGIFIWDLDEKRLVLQSNSLDEVESVLENKDIRLEFFKRFLKL